MSDSLINIYDPWAATLAEQHKSVFESPSASDIQGIGADLTLKSLEHIEGQDLNVWKSMGFVFAVGEVLYSYQADVRWVQDGFGMTEYEAKSVGLEIAVTRGVAETISGLVWAAAFGAVSGLNPVAMVAGGVAGEQWAADKFDNWLGGFKERADRATEQFYTFMPAIADELENLDSNNSYSFASLLDSHAFTMDDDGTVYTYSYVGASESPDTFVHDGATFLYFGVGADGHTVSYDNITVTGGVAVDLVDGDGQIGGLAKDYFNGAVKDVIGSDYADRITGDTQANSISGGTGNDTIAAGAGNDTITTGSNNDTLIFTFNATDTDTVTDFSLGNDVFDFSALGVTAYGLQADATEAGGTTTLHVNGMNIVVTGVTKTNLFNPTNAAFTGLIGGTAGNYVEGTSGNNTIDGSYTGDPQGDKPGSNNDTIEGNAGNDSLYGGSGNDTYVTEELGGYQVITEDETGTNVLRFVGVMASEFYLGSYAPANDIVARSYTSGNSFQGSAEVPGLMVQSSSGFELRYIQLDDVTYDLTVGALWRGYAPNSGQLTQTLSYVNARDTVEAGGGDDTVYAYGGDDSLDGGSGNDTLYSDTGADTLKGGSGSDALIGGTGNDTYIAEELGGYQTITEDETGTNTLRFVGVTQAEFYLGSYAPANDIVARSYTSGNSFQGSAEVPGLMVQSSSGTEVRYIELDDITYDLTVGALWRGYAPNTGQLTQTLSYVDAEDTVQAGGGNDTVYAYGGNDVIDGGDDADALYGGDENDSLYGGAGNDALYGESGVDSLNGGAGTDSLYGGAGDDIYIAEELGGYQVAWDDETGTNTLRFVGVTESEFYLGSYAPANDIVARSYTAGGSFQGSAEAPGLMVQSSSGLEVRYIELDDITYDLTVGALWRGYAPNSGQLTQTLSYVNAQDTVQAGGGNDTVYTYGGSDLIAGGAGDDALYGGDGNDTYSFAAGDGHDLVYDTVGTNVLDINGSIHHFTDSGSGNADRTYYLDGTGTDYIFIDDFNLNGWSLI